MSHKCAAVLPNKYDHDTSQCSSAFLHGTVVNKHVDRQSETMLVSVPDAVAIS